MNSKLFSFVLRTIFYIGFVCGSLVETKSETDAVKIIQTNIPTAATVTTLPPSTKDLKPQNITADSKNGTVISDKPESHSGEAVPTLTKIIFKTLNPTISTVTPNDSTPNSTSNKIQDDKLSTVSSSPTPAVTQTKAAPPSEITTAKPPTTMTISSTTTHMVTILPTSKVEEKERDRGFDGPSFIGGIVLALGLSGIGFVAYKFCKARTDRNYRNL